MANSPGRRFPKRKLWRQRHNEYRAFLRGAVVPFAPLLACLSLRWLVSLISPARALDNAIHRWAAMIYLGFDNMAR
jgi:hypothetical protein